MTAAPIAERFSCAMSFFSNHLLSVGTSHILGTKLFSFRAIALTGRTIPSPRAPPSTLNLSRAGRHVRARGGPDVRRRGLRLGSAHHLPNRVGDDEENDRERCPSRSDGGDSGSKALFAEVEAEEAPREAARAAYVARIDEKVAEFTKEAKLWLVINNRSSLDTTRRAFICRRYPAPT